MVYSVVFPDRECGHRKEVLDVLDVKKFFDFQLSSIGYAHREPTNCVFIGHDMVSMRHVWGTLHPCNAACVEIYLSGVLFIVC